MYISFIVSIYTKHVGAKEHLQIKEFCLSIALNIVSVYYVTCIIYYPLIVLYKV
jgi:hypothetical protein